MAGLATRKARIPPDDSSRRWERGGSPRCHRVEAWSCRPRQLWGRGLHIHHMDLQPSRRARIRGVAPISCAASGYRVPLVLSRDIFKPYRALETYGRGGTWDAWYGHHRPCVPIGKSFSPTVRNWRSRAFPVERRAGSVDFHGCGYGGRLWLPVCEGWVAAPLNFPRPR